MDDLYDPNRNDPTRNDPTGNGLNGNGLNGHDPNRNEPDGAAADGADNRGNTPTGEGPGTVPTPAVPDSVPNSTPERIPSGGPDADRIRIGLWGAPRSGKTTYLTALPLAAMQHQRYHDGGWNISGMTAEAGAFLSRGMDLLTRQRAFPEATMGVREMAWSIQGPKRKGRLGISGRRPSFVLDIQDAAGEAFGDGHPQQAQLVGQLARSHGLIYLFDPLGDAETATESFNFLQSTLTQLTAQVRNRQGLVDGRLPHYVSVCVAKFDHPDIFRPAVEAGWVTQDTVGAQLPRVPHGAGREVLPVDVRRLPRSQRTSGAGRPARLLRPAPHLVLRDLRCGLPAHPATRLRLQGLRPADRGGRNVASAYLSGADQRTRTTDRPGGAHLPGPGPRARPGRPTGGSDGEPEPRGGTTDRAPGGARQTSGADHGVQGAAQQPPRQPGRHLPLAGRRHRRARGPRPRRRPALAGVPRRFGHPPRPRLRLRGHELGRDGRRHRRPQLHLAADPVRLAGRLPLRPDLVRHRPRTAGRATGPVGRRRPDRGRRTEHVGRRTRRRRRRPGLRMGVRCRRDAARQPAGRHHPEPR